MKGKVMLSTAAALSLALAIPAFAADYGTSSGSTSSSMAPGSTMTHGAASTAAPSASNSWKASDLMNKQVKNSQGQNLGKVSDVIVDNGGKAYVVLCDCDANNHYAVPWERLSMAPGKADITLDINKDQLRSEFSAFDVNASPDTSSSAPGSSDLSGSSSMGGSSGSSSGSMGSDSYSR